MGRCVASLLALSLVGGSGLASQDSDKLFVPNKDGQLVIEAEHFHAQAPKGPHQWEPVKEPAGFSGEGALEAKPSDSTNNNEVFVDLSPRLDYKVRFDKAGKYRVWVRGFGRTDSENSCHVGLDGKAVDTSDRIGDFPVEKWVWYCETHDGEYAVLDIKEVGPRTLNVWMRESGFVLDKILLSPDEKYAPADDGGPPESRE